MSRRPSPLAVAGALARATVRAVTGASLAVSEQEATEASTRLARRSVGTVAGVAGLGARVLRGEAGIGPLRLDPADVDWLRRQVAAGLRSLLLVPADTAERLRTADPTTMARTVLALVGGEESLAPLPTPEEQIRSRFRDLLDPDAEPDDGSLGAALLTITAQLSPDEARLLRHLATTDRAVVVAVDAAGRLRRSGPTVDEHLSVLVERSGGDHPDAGPAYVANLVRLGLCRVDWDRDGAHPDIALIERTPAYRAAVARAEAAGHRARSRDGSLELTALGRRLVAIAGAAATAPTAPTDEPPPTPPAVDRRHRPVARVSRPRPTDDRP